MLALSLPESVPQGIQAWRLPLNLSAPIEQADWNLLSTEEKSRAERFHCHADRVRMVATRAALRRQLSAYLGCQPSALCLEPGVNDKPRLRQNHRQNPHIAFNVSHSGENALIALSTAPRVASLGIDIEQSSPEFAGLEFDDLAEYAFTPLEREFLHQRNQRNQRNQPNQPNNPASAHLRRDYLSAFFLNWVTKEAALKAVGVGISEHLQTVSIRPLNNGQLAVEHAMPDWLPLHVCRLPAPQEYSAAIAWQVRPQ